MPGAATAFPVLLPRCDRSCHGLRRLALRVSCASRTAGALGNSPAARTTLAIPPAVPRGSASPSRPWPGSRNSASGHSGKGEAPARNPASWSFRTAHSADPESRKSVGHGGTDEPGFWIPGLASLARNDEKGKLARNGEMKKPLPWNDVRAPTLHLSLLTSLPYFSVCFRGYPLVGHSGRRTASIRNPGKASATAAMKASGGTGTNIVPLRSLRLCVLCVMMDQNPGKGPSFRGGFRGHSSSFTHATDSSPPRAALRRPAASLPARAGCRTRSPRAPRDADV